MNLPQPHPIKGPVPHPSPGRYKGACYLFFPPLCCIMSPNETLPEFLVWPLISFYWLKNPRTLVDNKPLSLTISHIVSIKKATSLFFFFLNWRNFKCGPIIIKDLFFGGVGIKKKFEVISLTPCWPTGHLEQLDTFQVLSYMTVLSTAEAVFPWACWNKRCANNTWDTKTGKTEL